MLFPVIESANPDAVVSDQNLPTGSERILLVDDEPFIVDVVSQLLRQIGYTVDAFKDSQQALKVFRKNPGGYDLVITDMTMPRMTGDRLAARMIRIRKNIPVVLCTGFSDRIDPETVKSLGIRALVMKPLAIRELAHKIREVLSGQLTASCNKGKSAHNSFDLKQPVSPASTSRERVCLRS